MTSDMSIKIIKVWWQPTAVLRCSCSVFEGKRQKADGSRLLYSVHDFYKLYSIDLCHTFGESVAPPINSVSQTCWGISELSVKAPLIIVV